MCSHRGPPHPPALLTFHTYARCATQRPVFTCAAFHTYARFPTPKPALTCAASDPVHSAATHFATLCSACFAPPGAPPAASSGGSNAACDVRGSPLAASPAKKLCASRCAWGGEARAVGGVGATCACAVRC
eukprot:22534-Chlamydomonas_euryale.AAC.1